MLRLTCAPCHGFCTKTPILLKRLKKAKELLAKVNEKNEIDSRNNEKNL
ncbi:MAG: hypothetical protein Q8N39_04345 [Pelolinea sp.]|nr:hypothetical protein [Pelolinea sp.]